MSDLKQDTRAYNCGTGSTTASPASQEWRSTRSWTPFLHVYIATDDSHTLSDEQQEKHALPVFVSKIHWRNDSLCRFDTKQCKNNLRASTWQGMRLARNCEIPLLIWRALHKRSEKQKQTFSMHSMREIKKKYTASETTLSETRLAHASFSAVQSTNHETSESCVWTKPSKSHDGCIVVHNPGAANFDVANLWRTTKAATRRTSWQRLQRGGQTERKSHRRPLHNKQWHYPAGLDEHGDSSFRPRSSSNESVTFHHAEKWEA